ncbi:hypothetical protein ACFQ2B_34500 [Streptomyces stramineus]
MVSHVTNPGLLRLPLHRSPHPDLTLVGFAWAKEHLLAQTGGDPDRVQVVGPLVAQHDLRDFMTSESAAPAAGPWGGDTDSGRPRLIVFCNRGGDVYLELVHHIAEHHPDTDLVFVGYDDPGLARRAAAGAERLAHWRFHSRSPRPSTSTTSTARPGHRTGCSSRRRAPTPHWKPPTSGSPC